MFFNNQKCSKKVNKKRFGIYDALDDHNPADIDLENEVRWVAEVINSNSLNLTFVAIDNCISISDKKCDGMLYSDESLYLIEIKNRKLGSSDWREEAKRQLEYTIYNLQKYNQKQLDLFKIKKAYIANKKRRNFEIIENSEKKAFFQKTGFRLDIQAEIKIER